MKILILYLSLFLITSCKEKQDKKSIAETKVQSNDSMPLQNDSIHLQKDSIRLQNDQEKSVYVERSRLNLKNYFITIKSKFNIPEKPEKDSNYYFDKNYLIVFHKTNNTADSLSLDDIDDYSAYRLAIEDFSDSLHFKSLLLYITWTGDSDMPEGEFVEFNNHLLKVLFSISNLQTLERKDEWTLSGFVTDRDEVVSAGQHDYPVTVSLKDYEVHITKPGIQYIGYSTVALANIKVYRDPKLTGISAYTIKKGKKLVIDTLYRSSNLLRLIVSDSIILYGRPDKISEKVEHDNAG